MGFSNEWDGRYSNNEHMSIWPWSNLITLVHRHTGIKEKRQELKLLELGCGAGANIPFFKSFDVDFFGVDGSSTIIENLKERFPAYQNNLASADFTESIPFDVKFDAIIDRAAITHNSTEDIKKTLNIVKDCLTDGGVFLGTGWFTTEHSEYRNGKPGVDEFTRTEYSNGPFANLGQVHFSTKEHLLTLFEDFQVTQLDLVQNKTLIPENSDNISSWSIVARKK